MLFATPLNAADAGICENGNPRMRLMCVLFCEKPLSSQPCSEWDEKLKGDGVRFGLASSNVLLYVTGVSRA